MMTFLRYLDVMSCRKKGLGSPPEPTIWMDVASVAKPVSCRRSCQQLVLSPGGYDAAW